MEVTMNLFTVIYQGEMHHISARQFRAYLCIAITILISMGVAILLLGNYQAKQKMTAEINQAIKGNKYAKVEDFEFFRSTKKQTFITTNNYREVADISVVNMSHPSNSSDIAGMGSEGTVKVWSQTRRGEEGK